MLSAPSRFTLAVAVTYGELIKKLETHQPTDPATRELLTALVWSVDKESKTEAQRNLDISKWVIRGDDAVSVREELRSLLRESGGHVIDFIKLFGLG